MAVKDMHEGEPMKYAVYIVSGLLAAAAAVMLAAGGLILEIGRAHV